MSTRLIQELHAGISRRDWSSVEMAANRLRDEVEKTVTLMARTGIGSLPNDYPFSKLAADLLSEAERREREARVKLQAMHRRAQESERVEQMIIDTLGMWYKLFQEGRFKPRAKRGLFFAVMKELKVKADKIRAARSALQSEER
ncbi:MAG TPA: hypothetical protein DCW88_19040 [Agrobacterium sp.]|uniref:hypothetical protein n=1 Tax=Agrobacterium pusense TaxID=648995 RepID=UPI000E821973|nr:hypothetical protein [Agrobacterium sp.]